MLITNILFKWRLLLGCITGVIFLYFFLPSASENTAFEELALGKENTVLLGQVNGLNIHCHDLNDLDSCISSYRSEGHKRSIILWLGNSQIHAINQYKFGQETAVPILHRRFQEVDKYLLTLSQPNASLQEHYLLFAHIINQFPIEMLILPIVFDDMREDGIRLSLNNAFKNHNTTGLLSYSDFGKKLIDNNIKQDLAGNDMAALEGTIQESFEKYLNKHLDDFWPIWSERSSLRGSLLNFLYEFRNWSLGINPQSKRKIIPGRYQKNRDAFEAILQLAEMYSIKVLVYIAPIRNDIKMPYDDEEYIFFKKEIKEVSQENKVDLVNLENIVPGKFWGSKESTAIGEMQELDFMHFKSEGHELLAERLYQEIKALRPNL